MATNFGMLLAAVMVAAVGGSVHLTMSVSLVSDLLPPDRVRYCLSPIVRQAALMSTYRTCSCCAPLPVKALCGLQSFASMAMQCNGKAESEPSAEMPL